MRLQQRQGPANLSVELPPSVQQITFAWATRCAQKVSFRHAERTHWNAIAGAGRLHSAPKSVDDFAQGIATLMECLIKTKHYTCIP